MKERYRIVKRKLFGGENATKWKLFIFFLFWSFVSIFSSHSYDKKVYQISRLSNQVKELRGQFVDGRSRLQRIRLESRVLESLKEVGLKQSETPPHKIRVEIEE